MAGYDAYITRVPDDDPEGEHQDDKDRCPDCGALDECDKGCGCAACRRRDWAEAERAPKGAA